MAYEKNEPADVREVQEYLRCLSRVYPAIPPLAVDGIYGSETAEAVRAFQQGSGLPVTGETDADTWVNLRREWQRETATDLPPCPLAVFPAGDGVWETGDTGDGISVLQLVLGSLAGCLPGLLPAEATGVFDEATAAAVKAAQTIFGLEPTGRVDRRTWDRLAATHNTYVGG